MSTTSPIPARYVPRRPPTAGIAIVLCSMRPRQERLLDVDTPLAGHFVGDREPGTDATTDPATPGQAPDHPALPRTTTEEER